MVRHRCIIPTQVLAILTRKKMLRPRRHKHFPEKSNEGSTPKSNRESTSSEIDGVGKPSEKEKTQPGLRLGHDQKELGQKPTRSSPLPWNRAVATHRREHATDGLLLGCAVAEALSLARNDLHPRVALKLFGRNPLGYQFQPSVGVTSHRTHLLLMTFQALLQSKTDPKIFAPNLRKRIAWYQRAFLFRHAYTHLKRVGTSIRKMRFDNSMTAGLADDPLIRAVTMSIMLQGVADSSTTWFQLSTGISHSDPRALCASTLVGFAGQLAQMVSQQDFKSTEILNRLIDVTDEETLKASLVDLRDALAKNLTVSQVARRFGWKDGIPNNLRAFATIGIYAWLRHPKNFRTCVERTILLGGSCSGAAVIAGALSGISLGPKAIPSEWRRKVSISPHTNQWKEFLIERVKDWPHGVEDIHRTRALPSMVCGQIVRNASYSAFRLLHGLIRLPMKIMQFSVVKRVQRSPSASVCPRLPHSKRPVTGQ